MLTRPQPHEAEAEATTHETEAEATTHESEAEVKTPTHDNAKNNYTWLSYTLLNRRHWCWEIRTAVSVLPCLARYTDVFVNRKT